MQRFPESFVKFYASELVLALKYLHDNGVAFRDLKPENVLLDLDGHIKLTDFGLAKEGIDLHEGADSWVGTPAYFAPEILQHRSYGMAVDWWALGILMY